MSFDGFVIDIHKDIQITATCYECGKDVDLADPSLNLKTHKDCLQPDGRLRVNLEFGNYEDR